jgi:hypothetical protein
MDGFLTAYVSSGAREQGRSHGAGLALFRFGPAAFGRVYTRSVPSKITSTVASKDGRKDVSAAPKMPVEDTSDQALAALLSRLKAAVDPEEIRQLSAQIERVVFHKQFTDG